MIVFVTSPEHRAAAAPPRVRPLADFALAATPEQRHFLKYLVGCALPPQVALYAEASGERNTIKGTVKVIEHLPEGTFALGLTRPSPYPKGPPLPAKDVFLPVLTPSDIYRAGFPRNNPTPSFNNPTARAAINAALIQNSNAKVDRMFPDGPDHLHREVLTVR